MRRKLGRYLFLILVFAFICTGTAYGADSLDEVRSLIQTRFYQDVNEDVLTKGSAQAMVEALNDPHSSYISPEDFKDYLSSLDGNYVGVGMYINESKGQIQVVRPIPGSPAEKAGLKEKDIITHINDKDIKGLTSSETAAKVRGPEGTKVKITVMRGGQTLYFTVERQTIEIPSLDYRLIGTEVGYIQLYSFSSNSAQEMSDALKDLTDQGMETLVLDLRDNPGGLLNTAVEISADFVPRGPVVHVVQKGDREYTLRTFKTPYGIPVAVLVNEGTASAAEILAGAIQDAKTGVIVGSQTYGKGSVQTIFSLSDGGGLKLTTAKYLTRGRQDINGKGLTPDIMEADENKQFEVAVKKLGSEMPLFDVQMAVGSKLVFVDDQTFELPVSPYMEKGTVMVPLRQVADYLGGDVRWENGTIVLASPTGNYKIDSVSKVIKSAQGEILGQGAIKEGTTMVPARVLADMMGFKIGWHQKDQMIYLYDE
ncbi:S41 family peptidase [Dehalobacterium formicoaceticum]|uniref:S41 family peptidase n=1 Tax=Dehalobacterium formicoaceticum TaxID=51515 RepID=A0ABT1Y0R9_9FIRM|nr:S41 family peptidase [Dehalobacterium formicoaceticum]MCR6544126.1 S41 family peptidase [Dehalobacterium formicoaceticum]